jgi:predicted secreted Zn-dependent protease
LHWTTNYYSVTGATLAEIRLSLNQSRPWKNKFRTDGYTAWRIDWQFNVTTSAGGCRCSSFTTTTAITITLPRWTAPTNASQSVHQIWERYITALGRHEAGHAQIARSAADEIHKRVNALGEGSNCDGLKQTINDLADGLLVDFRRRDAEYDQRTNHGATQGAVLPRPPRRGRPRS